MSVRVKNVEGPVRIGEREREKSVCDLERRLTCKERVQAHDCPWHCSQGTVRFQRNFQLRRSTLTIAKGYLQITANRQAGRQSGRAVIISLVSRRPSLSLLHGPRNTPQKFQVRDLTEVSSTHGDDTVTTLRYCRGAATHQPHLSGTKRPS